MKKLLAVLASLALTLQPLALRAEECNDWNEFYTIQYPVSTLMGLYQGFNTNYLGQVQAYAGYLSTTPRNIEIRYSHTPTGGFSATQLPSGNLVDIYTNVMSVSIYSNWYWPNTCNGYEYVSVSARIQSSLRHAAVMTYAH